MRLTIWEGAVIPNFIDIFNFKFYDGENINNLLLFCKPVSLSLFHLFPFKTKKRKYETFGAYIVSKIIY